MSGTGDNYDNMNGDECELLLSAWECLFWWMIVYLTNE